MSAVAEHEARAISARTKAALAQAKLRGVKLGNPNLTVEGQRIGTARCVQSIKDKAAFDAKRAQTTIAALQTAGKSLRMIADELNAMSVKTPRGKQWTAQTVKSAMAIRS